MSLYVAGLALAAGYLINKNLSMVGQLNHAEARYQNKIEPSTNGTTSAEIRNAWANTDFVKFGDMREDLPQSMKIELEVKRQKQIAEAQAYDSATLPVSSIRGVLLSNDRLER